MSFLDLISLRAVAAFKQSGLNLRQVQRGARWMQRALGVDHPLAHEALRDEGVHRFFGAEIAPRSAGTGWQVATQALVNLYLREVVYGPAAGQGRLATAWEPPGVSLDPRIRRGAPCVAGSRVPVAILHGYVEAGDPPDDLAELFELDPAAIRRAVRWYEGLKRPA